MRSEKKSKRAMSAQHNKSYRESVTLYDDQHEMKCRRIYSSWEAHTGWEVELPNTNAGLC